MIPIFRTHFSVGKSILTPEDCFELGCSENLETIFFLETTFASFRKLSKLSEKYKQPFVYGVQFLLDFGKLNVFAKNSKGIIELKQLFSSVHADNGGKLSKQLCPHSNNLLYAFPHYDSPLFKNHFYFAEQVEDFLDLKPIQFIEENDHPFDFLVKDSVSSFCSLNKVESQLVKSICYKKRVDVSAMQFYSAVDRRTGGKNPTFDNPNLEHFCSPEFCWESYLDKVKV